jgi:transposase-like protein
MTDPLTKVRSARKAEQKAHARLLAAIAEAVASGVPKTELARELGVNRLTIYRWLEGREEGTQQ